MRTLIVCLGLCAVLGMPNALSAQNFGKRGAKSRLPERPRRQVSRSEELVRQRAMLRARQRSARIQWRKMLGISLTRPTYGVQQYREETLPHGFPETLGVGGLRPHKVNTAGR